MGRRIGAVDQAAPPHLKALAEFLREVKATCGVTFRQMAAKAAGAAGGTSTFIAVASGGRLPSHASVRAYIAAAHAAAAARGGGVVPAGVVARADRLWLAAYRERATGGRTAAAPPYPRLDQVRTAGQLAKALTVLRERAGAPPLRFIELRTGEAGCRVPRATLSLILAGSVLPTRAQLEALLVCFGVRERSIAGWRAAWERARSRAVVPVARAAPEAGPVLCADSDPEVQHHLEQREREAGLLRKMGKLGVDEDLDDYDRRRSASRSSSHWWDLLSDEEQAELERSAEL